jgi:hypothetical protein
MQTTAQKHLDAIAAGVVTATNVIGIRKAMNARERREHGFSLSRQEQLAAPRATLYETALADKEPRVCGELHESGLAILRNPRWRKRFTDREREIIETLDHFRLVRFDIVGELRGNAVPIYRAVAKDGRSFLFRNVPWQLAHYQGITSGPEVLRECD